MERYESKHVQILHPARAVYGVLADFNHLTPVVGDKVEGWCATENTCSFKVQGFTVNLQMIEKVEHKLIKVTGADGSPMDFTFWLQLVSAAETDTRMRIVLDVELPMMMKMMVGKKLAGAVDQIAEKIAEGFNSFPAGTTIPKENSFQDNPVHSYRDQAAGRGRM